MWHFSLSSLAWFSSDQAKVEVALCSALVDSYAHEPSSCPGANLWCWTSSSLSGSFSFLLSAMSQRLQYFTPSCTSSVCTVITEIIFACTTAFLRFQKCGLLLWLLNKSKAAAQYWGWNIPPARCGNYVHNSHASESLNWSEKLMWCGRQLEVKPASVANFWAASPALNVSTFLNSCFQCASSKMPSLSLILLTTSRGVLQQYENYKLCHLPVWWWAICIKPCYCVHPLAPPVLGIFTAKSWSDVLIYILWAKERVSTSARTLPSPHGEGGEPLHFVTVWFWLISSFNNFLLAENYPALCALYQELTHGNGVFPRCIVRVNISEYLKKLVS